MCGEEPEIDENSPVSTEERILRRVLNDEEYYDPSSEILPVTPEAFRPTKWDLTGISVFRRLFIEPQDAANGGTNIKGYYVAQLLAGEIIDGGMTVEPDPIDGEDPSYLPGHTAIPEINYIDFKDKTNKEKKDKIKELQLELAILASKDIVYTPNTD